MPQPRYICWTLHKDYDEQYGNTLLNTFETWEQCTFVIFQWEICPTTNRSHIQGYSEFKRGVRYSTFKNKIREQGCHLERRMGTSEEASDYCEKEESRRPATTPFRWGERRESNQGARTDLETIGQAIVEGIPMAQIAQENLSQYIRYHRGFDALRNIVRTSKRNWQPEVFVLWGPPGTGKTRYIYDNHPMDDIYEVSTPRAGSEVWFDGYDGQPVILVDDFYGWFRWSFLLKFIDRYPQNLPVKGGFTPNLARIIYFTSNTSIDEWYNYSFRMVKGALERRITEQRFMGPEEEEVIEFRNNGQPDVIILE